MYLRAEIDVDITTFRVDTHRQQWTILCLVGKVEDKSTFNSANNQLALRIIEFSKLHQTDRTHIQHLHCMVELINKVHLKFSGDDQINLNRNWSLE